MTWCFLDARGKPSKSFNIHFRSVCSPRYQAVLAPLHEELLFLPWVLSLTEFHGQEGDSKSNRALSLPRPLIGLLKKLQMVKHNLESVLQACTWTAPTEPRSLALSHILSPGGKHSSLPALQSPAASQFIEKIYPLPALPGKYPGEWDQNRSLHSLDTYLLNHSVNVLQQYRGRKNRDVRI